MKFFECYCIFDDFKFEEQQHLMYNAQEHILILTGKCFYREDDIPDLQSFEVEFGYCIEPKSNAKVSDQVLEEFEKTLGNSEYEISDFKEAVRTISKGGTVKIGLMEE